MDIQDQLLQTMLEQQDQLNQDFLNMEVVYEDITETLYHDIDLNTKLISRTEIFIDNGVVTMKRFINGRLHCVEFTSLGVPDIVKWLSVEDTIFIKCSTRR